LIYNKKKHLELLKYSQDLDKQGKFLGNEEKEKYLKLLKYSRMMGSYLYMEIKDQYLKLMKEFVDGRIGGSKFRLEFLEKYRSIDKTSGME